MPDVPARRLPWVLPAAIVLVLLAFMGMGHVLRHPELPRTKPETLETRIYELPNSPGSLPGTAPGKEHPAQGGARPAGRKGAAPRKSPAPPPPAVRSSANGNAGGPHPPPNTEQAPVGHPTPPAAPQTTPPPAAQASAPPPPKPPAPAKKTPDQSPPKLDWSTLSASVRSAVAQTARSDEVRVHTQAEPDSEASLPNVHDPHTLVARYYIASLLRKLQRVGNMNYPTDQIGTPVLRLIIGSQGELQNVTLIQSSGNDALDQSAEQIARQSSPFPPFPDSLKRQTSHIVLVCHMSFEGYRQINPSF